jgi:acyl carrier protein
VTNEETLIVRLAEILGLDPSAANPGTEIEEGLMDSLRTLDAISLLDEVYGITVPSDELVACRTLGAVRDLADAAQREQGVPR